MERDDGQKKGRTGDTKARQEDNNAQAMQATGTNAHANNISKTRTQNTTNAPATRLEQTLDGGDQLESVVARPPPVARPPSAGGLEENSRVDSQDAEPRTLADPDSRLRGVMPKKLDSEEEEA